VLLAVRRPQLDGEAGADVAEPAVGLAPRRQVGEAQRRLGEALGEEEQDRRRLEDRELTAGPVLDEGRQRPKGLRFRKAAVRGFVRSTSRGVNCTWHSFNPTRTATQNGDGRYS
jgi:hypothetical protein